MLRAIRRCLGALCTTALGAAARSRNSIHVLSWRDERAEQYQPNTDSYVTATLTFTLQVRDVWAGGA